MLRRFLVLGCFLSILVGPACSSRNATTTKEPAPVDQRQTLYQVTADSPYYTTSPMQGRSADGTVPANTRVQLTDEKIGGYARVKLSNGQLVYIDLKVLQPVK